MAGPGAAASAAPPPRAARGRASSRRPTRFTTTVLAAATLTLALLAPAAHAHGTLLQPRSRNFLAYLRGQEYYAHGLSAGGAGVMSDSGALSWPAMRLDSICGGAPGNKHWDAPGEPVATYGQGGTVNVDSVITVNHLGRVRVRLCPLDAKRMDGRDGCVDLERADGKGTYWYLPFVAGWAGGTHGNAPPLYGDGFYEAYTLPEITPKEGCESGQKCDAYKDMVVYRTKWRLPKDYVSEHSKLVWEWMTAHSCWPPCPPELENEPTCRNAQAFQQCGDKGAAYPEFFLNCADVRVRAAARSDGGQPVWRTDVSKKPAEQWGAPVIVRMNDAGKPQPYKPASGKAPFAPGPQSPKAAPSSSSPALPPPPPPPRQYTGPAPPPPADSPPCYKTSLLQSRLADPKGDPQGPRWGFEDGRACRYVRDPEAGALGARAAADAEAAKAPRCSPGLAEGSAVADDEGRKWGFENGRSCLFAQQPPGAKAVAAAGAAPSSSSGHGGNHASNNNVKHCRKTPRSRASPDIAGNLWGFEDGSECLYVEANPAAATAAAAPAAAAAAKPSSPAPSPAPSPKPTVAAAAPQKAPAAAVPVVVKALRPPSPSPSALPAADKAAAAAAPPAPAASPTSSPAPPAAAPPVIAASAANTTTVAAAAAAPSKDKDAAALPTVATPIAPVGSASSNGTTADAPAAAAAAAAPTVSALASAATAPAPAEAPVPKAANETAPAEQPSSPLPR